MARKVHPEPQPEPGVEPDDTERPRKLSDSAYVGTQGGVQGDSSSGVPPLKLKTNNVQAFKGSDDSELKGRGRGGEGDGDFNRDSSSFTAQQRSSAYRRAATSLTTFLGGGKPRAVEVRGTISMLPTPAHNTHVHTHSLTRGVCVGGVVCACVCVYIIQIKYQGDILVYLDVLCAHDRCEEHAMGQVQFCV